MKLEARKVKPPTIPHLFLKGEGLGGWVKLFYVIASDFFVISLMGYLLFLWLDRAYNQCISNYFSLNIILGLVLLSGIMTAILRGILAKK